MINRTNNFKLTTYENRKHNKKQLIQSCLWLIILFFNIVIAQAPDKPATINIAPDGIFYKIKDRRGFYFL